MDFFETMVRLKLYYNKLVYSKHAYELRYWRERHELENGGFENDYYSKLMPAIAGEEDDGFLKNKVVADFGCGPRGSLVWAKQAKLRIGIDVLIPQYTDYFPRDLKSHGMIYVTSTEKGIPLPDAFCDVVFSVNSLDHVRNLVPICNELRRILKPGGWLIVSFNLNHPPSTAEPQKLGEHTLRKLLFRGYEIRHWWVSAPGLRDDLYRPLYDRQPIDPLGGEAYLWARAQKPKK